MSLETFRERPKYFMNKIYAWDTDCRQGIYVTTSSINQTHNLFMPYLLQRT